MPKKPKIFSNSKEWYFKFIQTLMWKPYLLSLNVVKLWRVDIDMWEANERQKLLETKTTKISKLVYFASSIEHYKNKFDWTPKQYFWSQFGPVRTTIFFLEVPALLDVRHCPKLQSCAISRKTNDANSIKWRKR